MPFTRYTADDDGAYTFHDDDAGTSIRAAGPAAVQRARELDAATPMSLAGLPPVPPRPEAALLAGPTGAAAPPLPTGDAAPALEAVAAQRAALEAAARPKTRPTAADAAALAASGARGKPTTAARGKPPKGPALEPITDVLVAEPIQMDADAPDFLTAPMPGQARQGTSLPPQPIDPATGKPIDPATGRPVEMTAGDRQRVAEAGQRSAGPGFPVIGPAVPYAGAPVKEEKDKPQQAADRPPDAVSTSDSTTVQSGTTSASQSGFQRSLGPSAETERAVVESKDRLAQLQAQTVNEQAKASQQIAAEREKLADLEMTWQKEQALIEQRTQERLAPVNAMMEQTTADVREARVDPQRLWKERGTGAQILAGISVLLGGLAQGLGAKTNGALDAIENAVNRDIQLQMQAIEKKRADVGTLGAVAQTIRQQGFDARTQELGMKITGAEAIAHNIESIAAKADAAFPAVIDPVTGKPKPGPVSLKAQTVLAEMHARVNEWRAELSERVRGQVSGQTTKQTQSQVSKTTTKQTTPREGGDGGHLRTVVLDDGNGTQERWAVNDELRDEDYSKMIANAELIKQLNASLAIMRKSKTEAPGLKGEALRRVGEQFKWHSIQAGRIISTLTKQGVLQTTEQQEEKVRNGNIVDGERVIEDVTDFARRARSFIIDQGNATQVPMEYGKAQPYAARPAKAAKPRGK